MSETRRLKIKIGDAEFEADVPESKVQPMYDRFLFMLERRRTSLLRLNGRDGKASKPSLATKEPEEPYQDSSAEVRRETSALALTRVFDLRQHGAVILKVVPNGPAEHAYALLLLLYGYYRVKNEECVLATELYRSAEQSGITLRRISNEYARNRDYVVRGGQGKGSHYSLNSEGLAIARETIATILERTEKADPRIADDVSFVIPQVFGSEAAN